MIQLNPHGRKLPVLEVGLGQAKGFIIFHSAENGGTRGDGDAHDRVEYVYMGNLSEVPADVEVDIAQVRAGLVEFMQTGTRPGAVVD